MIGKLVIEEQQVGKLWQPKTILFSRDALSSTFGQEILERVESAGIPFQILKSNRITGIQGKTDAETYRNAKSTLAVVNAPAGQFNLQPIPPSADFQFHLAQGCPAHCQYCYLAGSLQGLPIVRAYANLPEILQNTQRYEKAGRETSFEASCYTNPLSLEHITGSLSATIRYFAERPNAYLRWVTKYSNVEPLLHIDHNGRTRCRMSVNAEDVVKRFEAGAATLTQRLSALTKLIKHNYPIGLVVAPIIPIENWKQHYLTLFERLADVINPYNNVTIEFITHRFTDTSKAILELWYPASKLPFAPAERSQKFNKFGGVKYVYQKSVMNELKHYFSELQATYLPQAEVLYWT